MPDTKIAGYVLLVVGLIIIIVSLLNIYNIFAGKALPNNYFDFPAIEISLDSIIGDSLSPEEKSALAQQGESPKMELVPANVLNDTTNMITHIFIIGLFVSIGGRISTIGVYLLRPIKVNLAKDKE